MPNVYEGDSGLGAATTPEEWAGYVLDHLSHESVVLASGARRVDTVAKEVHVPRLTSDGAADWYDELEEILAGDPQGTDMALTPFKVAAVTVLSNEVVSDSDPAVLDTVGTAMTRAISLEADRALFAGGGGGTIGPEGYLNHSPALQKVTAGSITYDKIVTAGGSISAHGGRPDNLYLNPADYTRLQLATDGMNRPLIQSDPQLAGAVTIAGYKVNQTPALGAGTAILAQADQLVVAVRSDASVAFSTDAQFEKDSTVIRVVARLDGGIADANGVCKIAP